MVHLVCNQGFRWFSKGHIYCKGCFFDNNNTYYEGENMPLFFEKIGSFSEFVEQLKGCNGIFSVVIQFQKFFWLAVDRNISFPLFYTKTGDNYLVSDVPEFLILKSAEIKIDPYQQKLFEAFGHTFGNHTLFKNIEQVACGEAICLESKNTQTIHYHSFSVKKFLEAEFIVLQQTGAKKIEDALLRIVKSLNGKTAVVPLSGGFDSRLIASGLKTIGYTNVVCYTYGKRENNPEWRISKKVADTLGFKWIFVEYSSELIQKYGSSKELEPYIHFVGHYSSLFFLQEYYAVRYLYENNLIPKDSVFLPGHSGDLLGGSQLVKVFDKNLSFKKLSSHFIAKKNYYSPLPKEAREQLKVHIDKHWIAKKEYYAASVFEEIDIQEKISKVIFNSSLVYDYFGFEKRFIFWDVPLLDFFLAVPMEYRELKKLYDHILITEYFKPLGIHFESELQPTFFELKKQQLKNRIKNLIPKKLIKSALIKNDWLNYHQATQLLLKEMKNENYKVKQEVKSFNEVLISYYFFVLNKKLKELQNQIHLNK